MARCEWLNVDCPPHFYEGCSTRIEDGRLTAKLRKLPRTSPEYLAIDWQLQELAQEKCPLLKKLQSRFGTVNPEIEDFTDVQLTQVGARKLS